jgi:hypothetical protein
MSAIYVTQSGHALPQRAIPISCRVFIPKPFIRVEFDPAGVRTNQIKNGTGM